MRVTWFACGALLLLGAMISGPAMCAGGGLGKLIGPPAINVPSGGVVVTEINLSDDDVLGVIKQALPTAARLAAGFIGVRSSHTGQGGGLGTPEVLVLNAINSPELMEALQSLKGLRIIIAQYPKVRPSGRQFMEQFDKGVAKLGGFSKVLGDIAFFPGAAGVYALPENAGYIAYTYDPNGGVMYAARTVGFVDLPKLLRTVEQVMMTAFGTASTAPAPPPAAPGEPAEEEHTDTGN